MPKRKNPIGNWSNPALRISRPFDRFVLNDFGEDDLGLGFAINNQLVMKRFKVFLIFQHDFHDKIFITRDAIAVEDFIIGFYFFHERF